MSDELLPPVAADEMRISVEIGDDYQPSERVNAALLELQAALGEESGDDVEGFYKLTNVMVTSYSYSSLQGVFPSRSLTTDFYKNDPTYDKTTGF